MNAQDLNALSNEQLAQRYEELSIQEFRAELRSNIKTVNRLVDALYEVSQTLKSREGDAWKALLPLLDHENAQVRLNAARTLHDLEPDRATATLKDLSRWAPSAQRGAAGMALYYEETGISKAMAASRKAKKSE